MAITYIDFDTKKRKKARSSFEKDRTKVCMVKQWKIGEVE